MFLDKDGLPEEVVEPEAGRCVFFTAGAENSHCIAPPVSAGRRYCLTMWFTTEMPHDEAIQLTVCKDQDTPRLLSTAVSLGLHWRYFTPALTLWCSCNSGPTPGAVGRPGPVPDAAGAHP